MANAHVLTLEQMRAMASPVRQRVVAALYARGDSSVAEIAESLDRKPDTLYHHLRVLLKVGVIIKTSERLAGKNREAIYGPVAPRLAADSTTEDHAYLAEFARLVRNNLANAAVNHARAYRDKGKRRLVLFETANVKLTPAQIRELNDELRRFLDRVKAKADPNGSGHLYVFVSTPVGKK